MKEMIVQLNSLELFEFKSVSVLMVIELSSILYVESQIIGLIYRGVGIFIWCLCCRNGTK